MPSTVLVTGGYGFIGRNVSRYFARAGWTVIGLGHGSWAREEWRRWGIAEWHAADVTLDTLLTYAGLPDVIVHCAGSGSVGFSMMHPHQDFLRTVLSTSAILEFVRIHSPKSRIVYPSSAGVYGVATTLPTQESASLRPVSPYGVHKRMAEEMCQSYARSFDISAAIVRLFSVYGKGLHKQLLWDACVKIDQGENGFFGTGRETRDWLHIDDAASLLFSAKEYASTACPIVNGGAGEEVTVRSVLEELFSAFNRSDAPVFSGVTRSGDPTNYLADISLARGWGWQPKTSWREGVHQYAEWFKSGAL